MIKPVLMIALLGAAAIAEDIYATFHVRAYQEAKLALSSNGIVEKIYVKAGDRVSEGELLLELANDELQASVKLAQEKIALAELNLRYAKKAYERFAQVKDVVDEELFEQYASAYERALIELSSAKANLAYQQSMLEKSRLRAPFSGAIASKEVEVGDGVSSAMLDTLFTLITPDIQILAVTVDEKHWQKVKVGDRFVYQVEGSAKTYEGKVSKIYPAIDPQKRALAMEVPAKGLKVGLFGHGTLKVD